VQLRSRHKILPFPRGGRVAYRDGVGRLRDALGIRLVDAGAMAAVAVAVELNVYTGGGSGARPLTIASYLLYGTMAIPVLLRRKWPLRELLASSLLLLLLYVFYRRNISPAPPLSLPLYDAALAGYLIPAIVIPAVYMTIGLFVVEYSTHETLGTLSADFLLPAVVLALAVMLGDAVRSRRALAAETADKLRLAAEERDAEAARAVAEERLRIARELHDTIAHSMATIAVQAGSALHLLDGAGLDGAGPDEPGQDGARQDGTGPRASQQSGQQVRAALVAIRDTSKGVLTDIRVTLGQLRAGAGGPANPVLVTASGSYADGGDVQRAGAASQAGLGRLAALAEAVRAAGAPVTVTIEGQQAPLPASTDHAAYRILQESLTNVLRHAGPQASAAIWLSFAAEALTIRVTDDGQAAPPAAGAGHGLTGMAERAAAVGGRLTAGRRPDGGYEVCAWLPLAAAGASR
jgi:signal transduction histidine kinase